MKKGVCCVTIHLAEAKRTEISSILFFVSESVCTCAKYPLVAAQEENEATIQWISPFGSLTRERQEEITPVCEGLMKLIANRRRKERKTKANRIAKLPYSFVV